MAAREIAAVREALAEIAKLVTPEMVAALGELLSPGRNGIGHKLRVARVLAVRDLVATYGGIAPAAAATGASANLIANLYHGDRTLTDAESLGRPPRLRSGRRRAGS
jgi:hypothetical protein